MGRNKVEEDEDILKVEVVGLAPVVYIEEEAMRDITTIVRLCDKEVTWVGLVNVVEGKDKSWGDFLVHKVFLPKQKVTGSECEYDANDLARIAVECGDAEKDVSEMRLWGHSHHTMGVFASAQDQKDLVKNKSWLIQQITNKKGEFLHRLWLPEKGLMLTELDHVVLEDDAERVSRWKSEIDARVTEKKVKKGTYVFDKYQEKYVPKGERLVDLVSIPENGNGGQKLLTMADAELIADAKYVETVMEGVNGETADEKFDRQYQKHYGDVGGEG